MSWTRLIRNRSFLTAIAVLVVVVAVWGVAMARAAQPRTLDQRVNDVASQLQCLPCQGESVADSPSTWAMNVRAVIRAKLQHGESEQQVVEDLVGSYGDGIRAVPPMSGFTVLIWLGPVAMLLAGLFVVWSVARQWRAAAGTVATPDAEDAELDGVSETELERYRALLEADLAPGSSRTPSLAGTEQDTAARYRLRAARARKEAP